MRKQNYSQKEIVKAIEKDKYVVSREFKRNYSKGRDRFENITDKEVESVQEILNNRQEKN